MTPDERRARRADWPVRFGAVGNPEMEPAQLDLSILWDGAGRLYIPPKLTGDEPRLWRLFHEPSAAERTSDDPATLVSLTSGLSILTWNVVYQLASGERRRDPA